MRVWIGALWIAALPGIAAAQSLSGEYVFQSPNGPVTLVLEQSAGNRVAGVMRGADGSLLQLQGELDSQGRAIGTITVGGGTGWFAAGIVEGKLLMAVAEIDPSTGQPDMENGWSLTFERVGGVSPHGSAAGGVMGPGAAQGGVWGQGATQGGQPGEAEDTPLIREWRRHLSGRRVSFRDSYSSYDIRGGGGYAMRWDAYLCSDGTLVFDRSSHVGADAGSVSGYSGAVGKTTGTWQLIEQMGQVYIVYQMSDGTSDHARLQYQNGATYLEGERVYVANENPYCR